MHLYTRLLLLLLCLATAAHAQEDADATEVPKLAATIPLEQAVSVKVTGRDTAMLNYYNLYAFEYSEGKSKATGEILVPKYLDAYQHKARINVSLCRVTSFIMHTAANSVEVEDYIEITTANGKKQYFNFDPELPQPVLTLCSNQQKDTELE
ncbi:MAG TPA: hypothetical protein VK167_15365 [Flavipsychrobacter sp.]|nr:hypothetical protein [Flavipsychrobacter sp.]